MAQINPKVPARAMQTFQVRSPKGARVPATCEQVECAQYLKGWKMLIDLKTELGQAQAHYIKTKAGRSYKVESNVDGVATLIFAPNQPCFNKHTVRNDLPEMFIVKGGDHRGNPLGTKPRVHTKPEFWVEEFAENQDRIASAREKG